MEENGGMPRKLRIEYEGTIWRPSPLRCAGTSAPSPRLWRDRLDERGESGKAGHGDEVDRDAAETGPGQTRAMP